MTPSPDPSQRELAAENAPGSTPVIETHGLRKHFGQRKAVDGLTMSIPAGTIAGFVGPNGAGKTTTIRLLLGLVRPGAGSATILGQPLTHPERYLPRVGALIEAPAFLLVALLWMVGFVVVSAVVFQRQDVNASL